VNIGHHHRKWKSPILGVAQIVLRDVFLASIFLASRATLYAIGRRHLASIRPVSHQRTPWYRFWSKKSSCGIVKSIFEASVQKAHNRPSTQLIIEKATTVWTGG
jgi:hypothetical protein